MCHALRARASSVMAARVRLKMQCGTVVLLLVVIIVVCGVDFVCGMFEHRHCNHQHPRAHEVTVTKRTTLLFLFLFLTHSYSLSPLLSAFAFQTHINQATGLLVLLPFYHFFSPIFTVLFSFLSFVPQFSRLYFIKLEFLFVSVAMKSRDFNETCVSRVTCSCYLSYTHLYLACVPLYLEPMSIGSPTSTLYYSLDWLQV